MRGSLQLGLAGFVASGVLAGFLEWKGDSFENPQTADAAANTELREVGRELGTAARPESVFRRLRGAGEWLQEHSTRLNQEAARAADSNARKPRPDVRSAQARLPKRTVPPGVDSAPAGGSPPPPRARSPKPNRSTARNPERTVRSSPAKKPEQTVAPSVASTRSEVAPAGPGFDPTEPRPSLGFRLHRFLVGLQAVAAGVLDESVLKAEEGHGKYLVYLDLSVTNQDARRGCRFSYEDLRLQGSKGLVYAPVRPRDGLRANLEAGQTRRGGVAFAIYNDSAPARLLYRTGPESFAPLPESFFSKSHDSVVSQTDPAGPRSAQRG